MHTKNPQHRTWIIVVVPSHSRVLLFSTPWSTARRLPCPSLSPGACSNSYPLSRWCHPTISSSVVPFSSCLQSFPASGSFPMNLLFAAGGQSIGASASASVLPKNIQGWFPLGLTSLISLRSKGLSRVFSSTTIRKHQFFGTQPALWSNSQNLDTLVKWKNRLSYSIYMKFKNWKKKRESKRIKRRTRRTSLWH